MIVSCVLRPNGAPSSNGLLVQALVESDPDMAHEVLTVAVLLSHVAPLELERGPVPQESLGRNLYRPIARSLGPVYSRLVDFFVCIGHALAQRRAGEELTDGKGVACQY